MGPQEVFELPRSRTFRVGRSAVTTVQDAHDGGESLESGTVVEVIAHSNNPDAALWAASASAPPAC